ncbi:MAG: urease accessory protein UreD [Succinivibrio sp.]
MGTIWQAGLNLEFKADENGKTLLSRNSHRGPLMVQKPFYPEKACHVYILHPPGGVAGCDHLKIEVASADNTHVLLTTPGATKFYKTDGRTSYFEQCFEIGNNASLEYLPAQNIYYQGTDTRVKTVFSLHGNAAFTFRDVSCLGSERKEDPFEDSSFFNVISVIKDGREILTESCRISGSDDLKALSGNLGFEFIGTYICNQVSSDTLKAVQDELNERMAQGKVLASAGICSGLLIVRILSSGNEICEDLIVKIWEKTRAEVTGLLPVHPRIWST